VASVSAPQSSIASPLAAHQRPILRVSPGGGESVSDFAWNPIMDSRDPSSAWFVASSRGCPAVQQFDAFDGHVRASFVSRDESTDELVFPLSVALSSAATMRAQGGDGQLFAGFEQAIRVFDLSRPGRDSTLIPTKAPRSASSGSRGKRGRGGGGDGGGGSPSQSGLISCMDANPLHGSLLAAGSYNGTVGLYNLSSAPSRALEHSLFVHSAGVSSLRFTSDGGYLIVSARRSDRILVYDTHTHTYTRHTHLLFSCVTEGMH
jgi:WD40 repeat protein